MNLEAYLIIAAAILLAGFGSGYVVEKWHADSVLERLKTADAQAMVNAEMKVRMDLEGQLAQAKATSANNAQVIQRLRNENASITADRDANLVLARRLLSGQTQPAARSYPVPKASRGQGASRASRTGQDESLAGLIVDAADECGRNAARLDAIIAEIRPQL